PGAARQRQRALRRTRPVLRARGSFLRRPARSFGPAPERDQAVVTCPAHLGGVVGASEHVEGSTVTASTSELVTSLSANANTEPSSPGRTHTAAAGVSPSITQSSYTLSLG